MAPALSFCVVIRVACRFDMLILHVLSAYMYVNHVLFLPPPSAWTCRRRGRKEKGGGDVSSSSFYRSFSSLFLSW
ncbi:hypothetical protein V8C37DRAFT_392585 [Trichoderma ceciliae]